MAETPDLSLVPLNDLLNAIKDRCDAMVVGLSIDPGKDFTATRTVMAANGANELCVALATRLMVSLASDPQSFQPPDEAAKD